MRAALMPSLWLAHHEPPVITIGTHLSEYPRVSEVIFGTESGA